MRKSFTDIKPTCFNFFYKGPVISVSFSVCLGGESHDLRIFQYLSLREDHQLRIGEGFVLRKPSILGNEVYDWVRSGN